MIGHWQSKKVMYKIEVIPYVDGLWSCRWKHMDGSIVPNGGFMATESYIRKHFKRCA